MNFDHIIESFNLINKKKIAVAVSGGSDSMALSFLIYNWCKGKEVKLVAISIDHNLRDEAKNECQFVKETMTSFGIEHHTIKWVGQKPKSNILAKAREARYSLLIDFCKNNAIDTLFVGHNKEDVAETFLLNLERGSGLDGLSSINSVTRFSDIDIIRPLLSISRKELQDYLKKIDITWINDPSNEDKKYSRVRIRQNLLGNDLAIDRIVLAANHLRSAKKYLDKKMAEIFTLVANILPFGAIEINLEKFFALDEYEQISILTRSLQIVSGKNFKPRFNNFKILYQQILQDQHLSKTFMNCHLQKFKSKLIIFKEDKNIEIFKSKGTKEIFWDNRFKITLPDSFLHQEILIESLGKKGWQNLDKTKININIEFKNFPKATFFSFPVFKVLEKAIFIPYINYVSEDCLSKTFPETNFVFNKKLI